MTETELNEKMKRAIGSYDTNLVNSIGKRCTEIAKEYYKKQLAIQGVMQWVLIDKDNLPPLHKHVLLYDIRNDNHKQVFIHTETSLDTYRHWTHYAEIKKPFA